MQVNNFTPRLLSVAFMKCITRMKMLSYADRLSFLALESLETRRQRLDLIYLYKILFGKVDIEWSSTFEFLPMSTTRGHCSKHLFGVAASTFVNNSSIVELLVCGTINQQGPNTSTAYSFCKFCQSCKSICVVDVTVVTTNI